MNQSILYCSVYCILIAPYLSYRFAVLIDPYSMYGLSAWGEACKSYLDSFLKVQNEFFDLSTFLIVMNSQLLFLDTNIFPLKCSHYESILFDIRKRTAPFSV